MSSSDLSGYNTNDGDGCSSLCAIESNYICNGDPTSSSDSCSACPAGLSPDATKTSCVATCGDSKRAGSETCDDGNTNDGDGCSSLCVIESNFICSGGSVSSPDTCTACSAGLYPNTGYLVNSFSCIFIRTDSCHHKQQCDDILCIFAGYNETAKLVTIIIIQASYFGYLCVVRPFVMFTDNIVEIFLEGCLFCYIIALSKFDADSSWKDSDIITYIIFLFVAVRTKRG